MVDTELPTSLKCSHTPKGLDNETFEGVLGCKRILDPMVRTDNANGIDTSQEIGFIILRHVNCEAVNEYWNHCYRCIRKYYPEHKIVIIDDNSNYEFVKPQQDLYNTTVIDSEYKKRGEFLPYYYFLHNKFFDTAVILHDSVFINSTIDFRVDKYKLLWDFEHIWDKRKEEKAMIRLFNDAELLNFYNTKSLWKGCFGAMTVITHDYLTFVNANHDISKLIDAIQTRRNRCCFERVIACLLQKHWKRETLFGDIHQYCPWGLAFKDRDTCKHLPMIKVWTGR